jgi:photosystem II stability/assembly factor-like uncharacterized protein
MRVGLGRIWLAGPLVIVALLALAGCGAVGPNQWQTVGPGGAPITALATDPHIPGIIYAGGSDGATYLARGDHSGVFAPSTTHPSSGPVNVIFPNPYTIGAVYAGTAGGFYASGDYGQHYTAHNGGLPSGANITAITTTSDASTLIISVTQKGFYTSGDGGKSWQAIPATSSVLPANATVQALLWDGAAKALYAAVSDVASGSYVSRDAGATWSHDDAGLPPKTNAYALATLTPGASSVSTATSATSAPTATPASSGPTLFVGTSAGVYARASGANTTGAARWQSVAAGLPPGTVYALATFAATPDTLYAGVGQTVFSTSDGGQHWKQVANDLEHAAVALAVTPGQHAPVVAFAAAGQIARYPAQQGSGDSSVEGTILAAIVIGLMGWYVLGHYHIVPSMSDVRRRITRRR